MERRLHHESGMTTFKYLLVLIGLAVVACSFVLSVAIAIGGTAGTELPPPPTAPA